MASALSKVVSIASRGVSRTYKRSLHQTKVQHAITNFQMPAMSPTMTEGGIASWKKKEGESFMAGDVLLEIETDKATIDVEAQEDGVVGKIIVPDGAKNVPIGKVIALLAEEGDNISNLEAPEEAPPSEEHQTTSSSPAPLAAPDSAKPTSDLQIQPPHTSTLPPHSRPLFPSVHRLILENTIRDIDKIKGTGVRGMLTKGDILTYLGEASNPNGTFKPLPSTVREAMTQVVTNSPVQSLDGPAIRRLVVSSMLQASLKARNPQPDFKNADFESVIGDYLQVSPSRTQATPSSATVPKRSADYLDGLY